MGHLVICHCAPGFAVARGFWVATEHFIILVAGSDAVMALHCAAADTDHRQLTGITQSSHFTRNPYREIPSVIHFSDTFAGVWGRWLLRAPPSPAGSGCVLPGALRVGQENGW